MTSETPQAILHARRSQGRWVVGAVAVALAASMLVCLCIGPSPVGLGRALGLLTRPLVGSGGGGEADPTGETILLHVRLPRVCLAVAVGTSLSLAGVAMQALFRNPLASPYVLGVSSGASFGAALVMMAAGSGLARRIGIPPAATAMGVATSFLVYGLARQAGGVFAHTLLLSGLAVGAFFSALVSLILYCSGEWMRELVFWLMGGLWRATWADVAVVAPVAAVGYAVLHGMRRPLDVLVLGDRGARDVGLNVRRMKEALLVLGSVLAAVAVGVSGMIGFVGLMVPHLARMLVGGGHRRLVPASALGGGLLLLWADTLARTVREPAEIPVGIVTALLGTPFFLFLLRRAPRSKDAVVTIVAERITFGYGAEPVLRDLSFQANEGELVGLFGPNGSGKTTLLRCLSGSLVPDQGAVRLNGRRVADHALRELVRRVAVVPQDCPSDIAFSALDVVLFGRYPHLGFWEDESEQDLEAARRAMEQTETWALRDRRFCELSGGERQRIVLARALAQDPRLLLLDEPALHLDLCHQLALYELVRRLADERGVCAVMVCHDILLAPAYLRRVALLQNGQLVGDGPPKAVLTRATLRTVFRLQPSPEVEAVLAALRG